RLVERLEALAPADAGVVTALLFEASGTGVEAAIPVLARHGAEVDRATPFLLDERPADVTPLHLAANAGHAGAVRALLHAGAAPSPGATTGLATPLHLAARRGDAEATRALVAAGADLDAEDPCFGATPIQWAEFGGREEAAAVLREAGAERE